MSLRASKCSNHLLSNYFFFINGLEDFLFKFEFILLLHLITSLSIVPRIDTFTGHELRNKGRFADTCGTKDRHPICSHGGIWSLSLRMRCYGGCRSRYNRTWLPACQAIHPECGGRKTVASGATTSERVTSVDHPCKRNRLSS